MSLSLSALLAATDGAATIWMPPQGSEQAVASDQLFYFIYYLCVAFFISIVGLTFGFAWRYRRKTPTQAPEPSISHHTMLEVAWSAIPLLLAIYIFYIGFRDFLMLRTPPTNAYTIDVTAQKWSWSFTYPNGVAPDDGCLHVPPNEPVRMVMGSKDVLHAFYAPAFRVKQDVVPGRYTELWFTARGPTDGSDAEERILTCAEYCGKDHSNMHTSIFVHKDRASFDAWLGKQGNFVASAEMGKKIYESRCIACHMLDRDNVGPSWGQLSGWLNSGASRPLADGTTVKVDETYIHQSMYEPMSQIAAGFQPAMPTFKGQLKENGIQSVIMFIRSLTQPAGQQPPAPPQQPGPGH